MGPLARVRVAVAPGCQAGKRCGHAGRSAQEARAIRLDASSSRHEKEVESVSTLQTLGLFVGVPAAAFVIIALLCVAPSWGRDPRYRPGLTWTADPTWIGGPEEPDRPAVAADPARPALARAAAEGDGATASRAGGASASW